MMEKGLEIFLDKLFKKEIGAVRDARRLILEGVDDTNNPALNLLMGKVIARCDYCPESIEELRDLLKKLVTLPHIYKT